MLSFMYIYSIQFPMCFSCMKAIGNGVQEYITGNRQRERKGWESSHVCHEPALSALCTWSNMEKKTMA